MKTRTLCACILSVCLLVGIPMLGGCTFQLPEPPDEPAKEDPSPPTDDYTNVISRVGNIGSAGSYEIEYYKAAEPAQRQVAKDNIPDVVEDRGNLLVLDLTSWPSDWETGKIVAVRMPSGEVEYRRLLVRMQLSDGRLAIAAVSASVLEVIHGGELAIGGGLADTVRSEYASSARLINVIDYADSTTIWLIRATDVDLYSYKQGGKAVELGFPEIGIKATPELEVKLIIDKPFGWSDVLGALANAYAALFNGISDFLDGFSDLLTEDGNGQVVVGASADVAEQIANGILAVSGVAENLDAIASALVKPKRLKEATAIVQGDIVGTVEILASASAEYHKTHEKDLATVLVPIAGPIPIFLQFDLTGVCSMDFDAEIQVTSGAELTIPFYAGLKIVDGTALALEKPDNAPTFEIIEPNFEGTRAALELAAGVQCEAGVTLAKLVSATIDPTAEVVFDATAEVAGTVTDGCVDLGWDLYGRLRAELEAELRIPAIRTWTYQWDLPLTYTPLKNEAPMGNWRGCWGAGVAELTEVTPVGAVPGQFTATNGQFDISVSVLDQNGEFIGDQLDAGAFSFHDVAMSPQAGGPDVSVNATVSGIDVDPADQGASVTAVIVFDGSGSMHSNDPGAVGRRAGARAFFDQMTGGDEVALLQFGPPASPGFDVSQLMQDFTSDRQVLESALHALVESGGTYVYESILDGLTILKQHLGGSGGNIVVLTDGQTGLSKKEDAISAAVGNGVAIYPIGLGQNLDFTDLADTAQRTGGSFAEASDQQALANVFDGIAAGVKYGKVTVSANCTYSHAAPGKYTVSGELDTTSGSKIMTTPFNFTVTVVP